MALEIKRLHLASLQGAAAAAGRCTATTQFDLLIGDAAYTPRQYADPASDSLPAGQASDVEAWRESVRKIRSLRPEHVHFCHHTDIVHS